MKRTQFLATLFFTGIGMLNLAHGQASDPFAEPQRTSNRGATDQATSPDPFVVREAGATGADAEVRAETSQDNVAFLTEFVEVDRLALSDLFARGEVDLADGDAARGRGETRERRQG